MGDQLVLPQVTGPALVAGPIFLCFELQGKPGHKARHRSRIVFPKGKKAFIHNYPDPNTAAYEKMLAEAASLFMRGKLPTTRPLAVLVHAFKEIPQSWSRRDKDEALVQRILPTGRPDADNYFKVVDAMNGIVFADDSQIVDARCIKRYSDQPGLRIEVREFVESTFDALKGTFT
jgi:Holliday junction resolvase RusA-like endonuclease